MRKSHLGKFGVPVIAAAVIFAAVGITGSSQAKESPVLASENTKITPASDRTSFYEKARNTIKLARKITDPTG